jgi:hypothetical protein
MTVQKLRNRSACYLVGGHFLLLILLLVYPGFAFEKSIALVAIIGPLFAGFTTLIIKYFASTSVAEMRDRSRAAPPLVFFAFLIPTCLYTAILLIVLGYAHAKLDINSFDSVKNAVGGLEALFGVYIGYLVGDLFKIQK